MTIYRMKMSIIQYRSRWHNLTVTGTRQSVVVDLGSDATTPGRGLYHGGDTGSHVANPDALCIKKQIKYR